MRIYKTNIIVFFLFVVISIVLTWPLPLFLNSLIIDPFDGLLITWIYNWNIHSLTSGIQGLLGILDTNIFFPNKYTLAFSDYHLPGSLLAMPLVLLSKEPLIVYNFNLLLGIVLTGWSLYLLLKKITSDIKISFLGSLLFTLSPLHLSYMPHPQLFGFWTVIFPLYFLISKNYLRFILFVIVAVLASPLNFYFLFFSILIYFLKMKEERNKIFKSFTIASLLCFPILLPYLLVSKMYNYVRPINDAIHFSLQFPDLLNISNTSRLSNFIDPISAGTPAFFGLAIILLSLLALYDIVRTNRASLSKIKNWHWSILSFLSFAILALGPALHIFSNTVHIGPIPAIPLPYLIFYYLIPGFSGFRTPSRWILLALLMLVIGLSIYWKKKLRGIAIFTIIILALVEVNFPFKFYSVPSVKQFPPEQIWLKDNYKNSAIIQFPIYSWENSSLPFGKINSGFGLETLREYYSTVHWHPMFNGFSGFSPKEWEDNVRWLQREFPSERTIIYLRSIGIKLILVPSTWNTKMSQFSELTEIASFPDTIIYRIK